MKVPIALIIPLGDTTDIDDMAKRRQTLPKTSAKERLNVGVIVNSCLLLVWLLLPLRADNDDDDDDIDD